MPPLTPPLLNERLRRLWAADEAREIGWGGVKVNPPLDEGLDIPPDQYDEWSLLDEPPPHEWQPEDFLNDGGFTLVAIEPISETYDPTWDRHGLDDRVPIQERSWAQIEPVDPISYIAMGDQDVIVSKRGEFIEQLRAAVSSHPGIPARHGNPSRTDGRSVALLLIQGERRQVRMPPWAPGPGGK